MPHEIRTVSVPKRRRKDGLLRFANDIHSQSGEDGIIAAIFEVLDKHIESKKEKRFVVDVGAWDGKHLSNSHALLVEGKNWNGLLIEADRERYASLQALHEPLGNITIQALVTCESKSSYSLPSILEQNNIDICFDLLSIDVDGADYWLFQATLEAGYRPQVAIVEFNPTMPHDLIFIQDRDDAIRHGSSLAALIELAQSFGYHLAETTTYNAFFVHDSIYNILCDNGLCFSSDTIIDLHDLSMGTSLYQLYDGTLKLTGCKKLLWHRLPLDETKIQHIDESKRFFPFAPPADQHSAQTSNGSTVLVSPVTDDDYEDSSSSASFKEQQPAIQQQEPTNKNKIDPPRTPTKRASKRSSKQRARRRRHAKNNSMMSFLHRNYTTILPITSITLALGIGIAIRRSRRY